MMKTDNQPRLCGGLFLELIIRSLKTKATAGEHYKGIKDGFDDQSVLVGLIRISDKDYSRPSGGSLKTITSNYRNCKQATSTHLPFNDSATINSFDDMVQNNYCEALKRMTEFANTFIDIGKDTKREIWLAKALLDVIRMDDSTDGEVFYCLESGEMITKSELINLQSVSLPALLLGVWHFIFMKRKENKANNWEINYDTIGKAISNIAVTMPSLDQLNSADDYLNEVAEPCTQDHNEQEEPYVKVEDTEPKSSQQTVYAQQFGENSKQFFGNIENLTIN